MNEFQKARLERLLETLPAERLDEVLAYIEFLMQRHGAKDPGAGSPLQAIAEKVEGTLRAAKMPGAAIKGTMNVMGTAGRIMDGLVAAGKAAAAEVSKAAEEAKAGESKDEPPKEAPPDSSA
jgi:uncharacterized protein DUF2281